MLHALREDQNLARYHTVRAPFWEGPRLYPHAGFCQETHVQICVRDTACIKGVFSPIAPGWRAISAIRQPSQSKAPHLARRTTVDSTTSTGKTAQQRQRGFVSGA